MNIAERIEVLRRLETGETYAAIADDLELTVGHVFRVAQDNSISRESGRPKSNTPTPQHEEVLELIRLGVSYEAIGESMGVSRQRIGQIAKRWGVTARSLGRYAPRYWEKDGAVGKFQPQSVHQEEEEGVEVA